MYRIGIDVGGTFTDLVAVDESGRAVLAKTESTPEDPSVGVMAGLTNLAEALKLDRPGLFAKTERNPAASFTGFLNQTEISKAYIAADCLVLPSDYRETWGLVVNEAMASGLPCVVSDNCGCAEDLVATINGDLSFPMGNIAAMRRALASMPRQDTEPSRLESQVDKFDASVSVETIKKLYQSRTGNYTG